MGRLSPLSLNGTPTDEKNLALGARQVKPIARGEPVVEIGSDRCRSPRVSGRLRQVHDTDCHVDEEGARQSPALSILRGAGHCMQF